MPRELVCLRCGAPMHHLCTEKVQMGEYSFLLGHWPNLLAGALEMEIYVCPACGKLEFFRADEDRAEPGTAISQITCPHCGKRYDMDYPKCPYCKKAVR